jgi:hypothetical protein
MDIYEDFLGRCYHFFEDILLKILLSNYEKVLKNLLIQL